MANLFWMLWLITSDLAPKVLENNVQNRRKCSERSEPLNLSEISEISECYRVIHLALRPLDFSLKELLGEKVPFRPVNCARRLEMAVRLTV